MISTVSPLTSISLKNERRLMAPTVSAQCKMELLYQIFAQVKIRLKDNSDPDSQKLAKKLVRVDQKIIENHIHEPVKLLKGVLSSEVNEITIKTHIQNLGSSISHVRDIVVSTLRLLSKEDCKALRKTKCRDHIIYSLVSKTDPHLRMLIYEYNSVMKKAKDEIPQKRGMKSRLTKSLPNFFPVLEEEKNSIYIKEIISSENSD